MSELKPIVLKKKMKLKKHLGIGALIAAAVFFFLPDMALFDLLPDFIGYALVLSGLSYLRDLNAYFEDAYDRFFKLFWIALVRYFSFFFVLALVTSAEQPDTFLLLTFVFGVFDLFFALPAWQCVYEGFSYLSARCDGTSFELRHRKPRKVLFPNRRKGIQRGEVIERRPVNRIEEARRTTVFFVMFKAIFTVLPEFAALSKDTETSTVFRLYDYIGILRFFAMLLVFIVGCIFLFRTISFIRAVKADEVLLPFYREKYRTEVLTKEHLFTHRHLTTALFIACVAMIFRVDFRLDTIHVIPDALLAAVLCIALLVLGQHVGRRWQLFLVSGIFALMSIGVNLFEYEFFYRFSATSIQTNEEAYQLYVVFQILKAIEQALFILLMLIFFRMLLYVIKSYTGFVVTPEETRNPSEKIRLIHKSLKRNMIPAVLFTVLSAVSKFLLVALLLPRRPGLSLDWLPLLDVVLAGLFAFFTIRAVRLIYGQVEYRFMLL